MSGWVGLNKIIIRYLHTYNLDILPCDVQRVGITMSNKSTG